MTTSNESTNINYKQNITNAIKTGKELTSYGIDLIGKSLGYNRGEAIVEIIIYMIIALVVVIFIFWAYSLIQKPSRECDNLNDIYNKTGAIAIRPIGKLNAFDATSQQGPNTVTNNSFPYKGVVTMFEIPPHGPGRIFSYYVKTAYNCCSPGGFKNSFVNLCALQHAIKLGARCLDFEIYSDNYKPVVATSIESQSLYNSFYIKETFNSLDLVDVLWYINLYAVGTDVETYGSNSATNSTDPLFLHLRIMTNEINTINLIAKYLGDIFQDKLLGSAFGNNNYGESFGQYYLIQFCNKCIIMVEYNSLNSATIANSNLFPLINILTNTPKYKLLREQLRIAEPQADLTLYNKNQMTMIMPNLTPGSDNYDPRPAMQTGCQFVAMNFQNFDNNLKVYFNIFDDLQYSFVLKQCTLRNTPVHTLISEIPDGERSAACAKSASVSTQHISMNMEIPGHKQSTQ
jgi:hypothetical protein